MSTKVPWPDKVKIWELYYLQETPTDRIRYSLSTAEGKGKEYPSYSWGTVKVVVDEFPLLTPAQVGQLPEALQVRWMEKQPPRSGKGQEAPGDDLPIVATQLKAQLLLPTPETVPEAVLIHDFSGPGPHSFPLREDDFKAIWRNLGYNIREFKVYKESSGILSGDIKINVVISDYGNLELYCPVEEDPSFEKLLSSLPEAKEQFGELKPDVGKYLVRCRRTYAGIHKEAVESTWQARYEGVARFQSRLRNWPPPLTPSFANLVYRLSIVYHQTSGEYGLPDKSLYQIRPQTGYLPPFSGLYLGEINLANGPDPPLLAPPPFPPFTKLPHMLEDLKYRHRNMIMKWSVSPAIMELLELFESLHGIVEAIKEELDDRIIQPK